MFDPTLENWRDRRFGSMACMRNILKAAAVTKFGMKRDSNLTELRTLIRDKRVASPPQWFQSMIAQGILFLNASFTRGGKESTSKHSTFWLPVLKCILEQILLAKSRLPTSDKRRALVICWWGALLNKGKEHAGPIIRKFPNVSVRQISWYNPAARGGQFLQGTPHLTIINENLSALGMNAINWLPTELQVSGNGQEPAALRNFILKTKQWHSTYLGKLNEELEFEEDVEPITGVRDIPLLPLEQVYAPLGYRNVSVALNKASRVWNELPLSREEKAAVYVYSTGQIYQHLNRAMRAKQCETYFPYLAFFLQAHDKLPPAPENITLYRGISLNLAAKYRENQVVTWWSITSCSEKRTISEGFSGTTGTLFHISAKTAVAINPISARDKQFEYLLAPGTRMRVLKVDRRLARAHIYVREIPGDRLVR
ncbi:Uracil-DNA glycosylase family 1 [Gracilaria domingensis]|nr:Uracil-DNA glycosylase family 1 [Gracilaria domingensis]